MDSPSSSSSRNPWVAVKFGGTSVSSTFSWGQIANHINYLLSTKKRVCVVISALTQVSNRLEKCVEEAINSESASKPESFDWICQAHWKLASELGLHDDDLEQLKKLFKDLKKVLDGISLLQEASPKVRARVMAQGELASTLLGIKILKKFGIENVVRLDARDILKSTTRENQQEADRFLEALVIPTRNPEIVENLCVGFDVILTQGFIASTPRGETCILGRGGSDTSASLFGALIDAEKVEIWTDVHGMFTADPRDQPFARLISTITYREAEELAAMGAKVLHPRCIGPCQWAKIPLLIKNTWDPTSPGTLIVSPENINNVENKELNNNINNSNHINNHEIDNKANTILSPRKSYNDHSAVMAVVRRMNQTLISLSTLEMWGTSGFLAKAFAQFEQLGISIDLVGTSQSTVTVTLDRIPGGVQGDPFQELIKRLKNLGQVEIVHPCAVVSIVGRKIMNVLHELGPSLEVFKDHQIYLMTESSENLNLSFVVDQSVAATLVSSLHNELVPKIGKEELFGETWLDIQKNKNP